MLQTWLYSIISVLVVSAISLVGLFFLSIKQERLKKILSVLVGFAAGGLLGDAFIHLLPQSFDQGKDTLYISLVILSGIFFFLVLEKIIKWHHCHDAECDENTRTLGPIILFGDGIHNFIDGVIIAGSFLVNIQLGMVTTLAVLLHEIPQEIGDFGVLLHSGYSRVKALVMNFISALAAVLGVVLILLIGQEFKALIDFIIPFTVGGFVYIAAADLIPEIHKEYKLGQSVLQIFAFLLGVGLMALLLMAEV